MTKDEVIELLQKVEFNNVDNSTNLEWFNDDDVWEQAFDEFYVILSSIAEGYKYRIKGKLKVRPYEAKDWKQFLNKVWLDKEGEPVIVLGYDSRLIHCSGYCGKWTDPFQFFDYSWAFENLTDPNGHPFGEIE